MCSHLRSRRVSSVGRSSVEPRVLGGEARERPWCPKCLSAHDSRSSRSTMDPTRSSCFSLACCVLPGPDLSTLFNKVADNGYKILYLTSRPLADWHAKRGLEGGVTLPRGPVLCSPDALFRNPVAKNRRSHHQEVCSRHAPYGMGSSPPSLVTSKRGLPELQETESAAGISGWLIGC